MWGLLWTWKVMKELKEVRNCHSSFTKGILPGLAYTGITHHPRSPFDAKH